MIVRMFLKDIVRWGDYGFEIVGAARNGEEALQQAKDLLPDLILTDVSMPQMDGVELTRQLRESGYDGAIIMLSCHEDFSLVKNAIQYGADEYLLKNHLSEETIGEMIQTVRSKVEERRANVSQREELRSLAQVGRQSIRREFLQKILSGSKEDWDDLIAEGGLEGKYRRCAVLMFQPVDADERQQSAFAEFCDQQAQSRQMEGVPVTRKVYAVLADLTAVSSDRSSAELLRAMHHTVQHFAEQYLDLALVSTQSAVHSGTDALIQALRQAYALLQYGFYAPGLYAAGALPEMSECLPPEAERFCGQFPDLIHQETAEGLAQAFDAALKAIAAAQVRPGIVLGWLRKCDQSASVLRDERFYASLTSLEQYHACVRLYELRRQSVQAAALPKGLSPTAQQAVSYIRAHCTESIGLGHVARHVGLTSTYFSTLFKKELGVGFSDYLLTERLNRICDQLMNSQETISAISKRNGFPDYQHFCKTFKKRIGVTPAAYRRGERL